MGTRLLREAVKGTAKVSYTKKPDLRASVCDACGKVFHMAPFCNDTGLATLAGTFDKCAVDPDDGKGMGNMFRATVCSFACADKLMQGGWKQLPDCEPYVEAGAVLARGECTVSAYVQTEDELVAEWESSSERPPHRML